MKVKLLVVRGKPQGKSLLLPSGEYVIGRGHECHIRPNSPLVSRQHCLLRVTEDTIDLRDLGSTNGTLLNGQRIIGERSIAPGDRIQVGPLLFEVALQEAEAKTTDTGVHCVDTAESEALRAADLGDSTAETFPTLSRLR
jgi:pSer/pThr/pTyr-binding forkhead associated (FHA) protein